MPATILDGRLLATTIRAHIQDEVKKLERKPGLAALLVGADPASHVYVNLKEKACAAAGISFEKHLFFATEPQEKIIAKICELNARPDIDGILVQLPLPAPLDENAIITAIDPAKDVDGFHPQNLSPLIGGTPTIIPGVAHGIVALIASSGQPLQGKRAALLVNSTTFALPIEYLLEKEGALVHIILAPADIETVTPQLRSADILVSAIGRPAAVTADMVKHGAIVIDVGTNRLPDGTLVGDIDSESVKQKAGFLSPVPGGVGPMTVAMLLRNVVEIASKRQ